MAASQGASYDFNHPVRQMYACTPSSWKGAPNLPILFDFLRASAAGIVTFGTPGQPRWNTVDGHRWTQAEATAALAHGVMPAIVRPWDVRSTGPSLLGSVPAEQTLWLVGGAIGADRFAISGCYQGTEPEPGRSYLAVFDTEQVPHAQRLVLAALYAYDPSDRVIHAPGGPVRLTAPGREQ